MKAQTLFDILDANSIVSQIGSLEKEWTYTLITHFSHDEQQLDLAIKGSSMVPQLSLSQTYLEFPSACLQQKIKKSLKI